MSTRTRNYNGKKERSPRTKKIGAACTTRKGPNGIIPKGKKLSSRKKQKCLKVPTVTGERVENTRLTFETGHKAPANRETKWFKKEGKT